MTGNLGYRQTPALDTLTPAPDPRQPEQTFAGNVRDELRLHGPLGIGQAVARWWEVARHPEVPVEGFDPYADREALRGYEDHLAYFEDARSPDGIESRKRFIDGNREARDRLSNDGSLTAALAVGALDPLNWVPIPGMMGQGLARGALRGAVGIGLSAQPTIALNALQDPTATPQDWLVQTSSTIALGTALGATVGKLGRPLTHYSGILNWPGRRTPAVNPTGTTNPDALAPTGIGLERFDYGGQDAYTGLKNSPVPEVQRIADEIAGIPGLHTVGARGPDETYAAQVGVETRAHWWQGQAIKADRTLGDIWLEYRGQQGQGWRAVAAQRAKDFVGGRQPGSLSHADFDERVGRAMHNDFKDTVTDAATPFVERAANALDELTFKPMGEALSREGLIGGGPALWQRAVDLDGKAAAVEAKLAGWQQRLAQHPNSARLQQIVSDMTTRAGTLRQRAADTLAKAQASMARGDAPTGPNRGAARYAPRMWLWDKARDIPDPLRNAIRIHVMRTWGGAAPSDQAPLGRSMNIIDERVEFILARIQKDSDAQEALRPGSTSRSTTQTAAPGGNVGPSAPIISAKFDIPTREVLDYVETSATAMISRYLRQTAPRLEMAKKFGGQYDMEDTIDDLMERIDDHFLGGPGVPTQKALDDAAAERTRVRAKVEQLRDITLGVFPRGKDPMSWDTRAVNVAKNVQINTLMGGAVYAALADVSGVVLREGWGPLFRGSMDLLQNRDYLRATRQQLEEFGEAAEVVLGERNMSMSGYDIDQMGRTWVERGLRKATGLMFQLNLLNGWTSMIKTWHGAVAMSRIGRDVEAWMGGSIRAGDAGVNDLRALGINKQTAAAIKAQLDLHGQRANSLVLPRLDQWTDAAAADHFRAALSVTLRSGTVTPGAAEKLSFQYTNIGGLATQFMSFPISAQKRIAMAGLQRKDAQTAQAIVTGLSMGFFIDYIRSPANDSRSFDERLVSAVDRSGLTGALFTANNLIETASRDTFGIRPMLGQEAPFGGTSAAKQVLSPLAGPTGAHLAQIIDALGPEGDTDARLGALRRSILYQNLWFVRSLASDIQRATGDALE